MKFLIKSILKILNYWFDRGLVWIYGVFCLNILCMLILFI